MSGFHSQGGAIKHLKACALFAAIASLMVTPYVVLGYSGHDFEFHVSSWIGVSSAWLAHSFPAWSEGANFGLGDPHLQFYPPLSFYLGGALVTLFPLAMAPGIFIWLALFVSGVAMYVAVKQFVRRPEDRTRAAVLYMVSPYLLTTALIRFAAAELLVQAFLPLTVLAFYEVLWRKNLKALFLLALLLGSAWLTNVPGAIILLYTLATVSIVAAYAQRSLLPVVRFIAAEAMAGCLAAFYLAPVWFEKKWIEQGTLVRFEPKHGLLFMRQAAGMNSLTNKFAWLFALIGIGIVLWLAFRTAKPLNAAFKTWIYLAAVSFFFLTPLSLPVWDHFFELRAVEFPFRFLPLLGVVVPLLVVSADVRPSARIPLYALLAALALVPIVGFLHVHTVADRYQPDLNTLAGQWARDGYRGEGEHVPVGAHPSKLRDLAPIVATGDCDAAVVSKGVATRTLRVSSASPCQVRLLTLFYPSWRAKDESGTPVPVLRDPTGLLLLAVPPGQHTVYLSFQTYTKLRVGSAVLSLATFMFMIVFLIFGPGDNNPRRTRPLNASQSSL